MLGTIMAARLNSLAAYMKAVFTGFVYGPAAHPRFDVRRRMMEDRLFKDDRLWLRLIFGNFSAALKI
tara:strand:- start:5902 stop:6102 length:201 start_codon:yes stop_codon:yes gene_type:complete